MRAEPKLKHCKSIDHNDIDSQLYAFNKIKFKQNLVLLECFAKSDMDVAF